MELDNREQGKKTHKNRLNCLNKLSTSGRDSSPNRQARKVFWAVGYT